MQTILFDILLILTVVWLLVGILFLWQQLHILRHRLREFGIRKGLKKLVISSKIRIFIGENQ